MMARAGARRADLIVIGGGPAGCAAAITAAGLGMRTILLERDRVPRAQVGETLHPGVESLFARLGVAEEIASADFMRHEGHWIDSNGERRFHAFGRDAEGPWRGYQAWRSTLHSVLRARAAAAGADLRTGVPARAVRRSASGRVTGVVADGHVVHAPLVIDAAGDTHWMARQLGLARTIASPPLVATYGYVRQGASATPRQPDAPCLSSGDHGWTWVAPVRPHLVQWTRVAASGDRVPAGWRPPALSDCEPVGKQRGADVTWRMVPAAAGPGWLIAGDGAWVLDPSSSHGVLKALMSGMLAGHVAASIAGGAPARDAGRQYAAWMRRWFATDARELRRRTRGWMP